MNKNQTDLLQKRLKINIDDKIARILDKYEKKFLEVNSCTNLISKNDEKFLFEKHIFDSLAINLFFKKHPALKNATLLDIGTGGGFPSLPVAICYEEIKVYALDSIKKKIHLISQIASELGLSNFFPVCERSEKLPMGEMPEKYDYITTRAVASLDKILKLALPHLKKGGYFIAYKSKKSDEELKEAKNTLKRFKAKVVENIEYVLPLEETFQRNLIIFTI